VVVDLVAHALVADVGREANVPPCRRAAAGSTFIVDACAIYGLWAVMSPAS